MQRIFSQNILSNFIQRCIYWWYIGNSTVRTFPRCCNVLTLTFKWHWLQLPHFVINLVSRDYDIFFNIKYVLQTHKKIIIEYSVFYWLILSLLSQTKVTTSRCIFSCCNISILVCDFFLKRFEFLNTRAVLCYAYVVKYLCKCTVGTFIYIYIFFCRLRDTKPITINGLILIRKAKEGE